MRMLGVTMTGFGPFRDEQCVDFTRFESAGIFLISGRTGAGKSTILDAICFALFGSVPRYDGVGGSTVRLRSDHCGPTDPTRVTLDFEAGGERYRIERTPEYQRPKTRGDGVTTEKATAVLHVWRRGEPGDGWAGVSASVREVNSRIAEIVQLTQPQFLQVILLAQNRFQEFLVADSSERQSLLRALFGTLRFEAITAEVSEQAAALSADVRQAQSGADATFASLVATVGSESAQVPGTLDPATLDPATLDWACERVAALSADASRTVELEAAAHTAATAAREAYTEAVDRDRRQRELTDARARANELALREHAIGADRERLSHADRAAQLMPFVRGYDEAAEKLSEAVIEFEAAREAAPTVPGELAQESERLTQLIGSLAAAVALEERLPELTRAADAAEHALATHDIEVAGYADRQSELDGRLATLAAAIQNATTVAAGRSAASEKVTALRSARAASVEADSLDTELDAATERSIDAGRARTAASATLDSLREHQRLGRAALLAQTLVPDEACAVCGSRTHPHPAVWNGQPVSDDDLADADAAVQAAHEAATKADARVSELRTRCAELRGRAGSRSVEQLDDALSEAERAEQAVADAELTLKVLELEHSTSVAALVELRALQTDADATRTALVSALGIARTTLADAVSQVEQARDAAPSVASRMRALETDRVTIARALTTRAAMESAKHTSDDARRTLEGQLAELGFADRDAAVEAHLDGGIRNELRQTIEQFDADKIAIEALLARPDLLAVPTEPADLVGTQATLAEADELLTSATADRATALSVADHARALLSTVESQLVATADLAEREFTVRRLASTLKGDAPNTYGIPLESFVLAAELEQIVAAANTRLTAMSQGRYTLEHSDDRIRGGKRTGLELVVFDSHTGFPRSPRSLSGGEKFLASLALALGLAEVVTSRAGGIRLDTLFIDEGFGSLDSDTLEVAMGTIDQLRQGGRTVGLISHVDGMKEQIPARVNVSVTEGGWSTVRLSAGA